MSDQRFDYLDKNDRVYAKYAALTRKDFSDEEIEIAEKAAILRFGSANVLPNTVLNVARVLRKQHDEGDPGGCDCSASLSGNGGPHHPSCPKYTAQTLTLTCPFCKAENSRSLPYSMVKPDKCGTCGTPFNPRPDPQAFVDDWNDLIGRVSTFATKYNMHKPDMIFHPEWHSAINRACQEPILSTLIYRGVRVRFGRFEQRDVLY